MNLYVWDDHFCDYTTGLAVVLAPDLTTARQLLQEQIGYDHPDLEDYPKILPLDTPVAFYVRGGS